MSNVPSLPPLSAVSDDHTRVALQHVYDMLRARGDGTEKWLTGNDLANAFRGVNIAGSSTGALGGIDNPFVPQYLAWVKPLLQTIEDTIQQSRIYKDVLGEIKLIDDDLTKNAAAIKDERDTRALETGALAEDITTLQTTVGGVSTTAQSALTLAQSAEGSINGAWTVKFNAAGQAIGVGLGIEGKGGTVTSSFVVVADKFMVARPDGSGAIPMLEMGEVNGVNVLGFKGTLIGADGYFTGQLAAATGTFTGELVAATGTFGGRLMAGVLDLGDLTGTTEYRSTPGTYYFTLGVEQTRVRYQIMAGGGGGGSGKGGEWNASAGGGGGGGAGEYKTGTLELSPGTQIRVIVGSGGAGATTWASAGAGGTASSVAFWNGSTWITLVTANPGGGGAGAPRIYQDNLDGWIVNGSGGGGYPAGETAPGGSVGSVSARGGKGANSVWGVGGTPGYPNVGWGSAATGHGAGGGGGAGYHAWRNSGADWNKGLFGGGASGAGGRGIVEFYNPNTVVLRNEFIALDQRVTAIEQRLGM